MALTNLFLSLSVTLLLVTGSSFLVVVHSQHVAPVEVGRTELQQEMYELYCLQEGNSVDMTNISKRDIMMRMCMCGILRDAIHPQVELQSIVQEPETTGALRSAILVTQPPPAAECINNQAVTVDQTYPCANVHLQSFLNVPDISKAFYQTDLDLTNPVFETSSLWGWYDTNGNEIVMIGTYYGVSFIDVSIPTNPVYLGSLERPSNWKIAFFGIWRDVRAYLNYVYCVTEQGRMQYIDMNIILNLRDTNQIPTDGLILTPYVKEFGDDIENVHTIFINEESGFAYLTGSNLCNGGLYMVDLSVPSQPTYAGCFAADGYTHEVTCVMYKGPDIRYFGREICFACNEDSVTIVDVTNKSEPVMIKRFPYRGAAYTHQGWLTDDHKYFLFGDELDEYFSEVGLNSKTYFLNVINLQKPQMQGWYINPYSKAIDHNQYIIGKYIYQANYRAGLRIYEIEGIRRAKLFQVGYFDIYPLDDEPRFNGAWQVYPFFPSGNLVLSGIEQGLFILKPGDLSKEAKQNITK